MKNFLRTFALIALFFSFVQFAHASPASCSVIADDSTYNDCCNGAAPQGDPNSCMGYKVKSCRVITSDQKYAMCGCTGGNNDLPQCVAYNMTSKSTVNGQIGSTDANPNTSLSTTPINNGNVTSAVPVMSNPAASCNAIAFKTLLDIAIWAKCIIGAIIIPGIFSLAFVVFLWGVFKFIRSSDLKDKQDSKQFIYAGLIGLFIMVSVWGIIKIATTTFGLDSTVPMLQTSDPLSTSNASKK